MFTYFVALGAFMSVRNFAERVLTDLAHTWWMVGVAYIGNIQIDLLKIIFINYDGNNHFTKIIIKLYFDYRGNLYKLYLGSTNAIYCWNHGLDRNIHGFFHGRRLVWI